MAELSGADVEKRTAAAQAWKALLGWVAFLVGVLIQIVRVSPSWARAISPVGFRHLLTGSSSESEPAFMALSVDAPTDTPPPLSPSAAEPIGKLTVVLDLDETLVCAYETSSLHPLIRSQAINSGLKCFEMECVSGEKDVEGKQKVNHVIVFERPGLQEFLQQISEFADLVLFTAGLEGYASPLVDRIDLNNRFTLRLYRPATVSTKYREHVKDLSCLSKDLCRTVLVDNNPFSFLLQPLNGIPCIPFSAGRHDDDELMRDLLPLLKKLSLQKDVRPFLYEKFRMPEWFQKHGIPSLD
ncbi:carboxy-terminal domain RNA polymerase II polypeptide A small phosphatase protein [Dioscorea alata]|uniref:Carboxy-terminal domain RNA polymerase II polypeptide A small phosphatase protein n=1 Tax=Dioscorea alata TaxID=55571 RepID=A0ACB7V2X1_DIOAL|nr:carboxy-terminal domain RNA polymerase II polypeptide A small phosphatase protein [Dioscorea alata]